MKLRCVILVIPLLSVQAVSAQNDADSCNTILVYAGRNYSLEERQWSTAAAVYDNYCERDNTKQGMSFDAGMDTVIDEIPFKGKLSGANNNERMQAFCKLYKSEYAAFLSMHKGESIVVNGSVNAWLECKKLATRGLIFTPQVLKTRFSVGIKNLSPETVEVTSFSYDKNLLSCKVDDSDQSFSSSALDDHTTKRLRPGRAYNSWNITCIRQGQQIKKGEKAETVYPDADFIVNTTKGAFTIPIPHDAAIPYQYASDIKNELDKVAGRIGKQEDRHYTIAWDDPIDEECTANQDDVVNRNIPGTHDICVVAQTSFHIATDGRLNVINSCQVSRAADGTWNYTVNHSKQNPTGGSQVHCQFRCGTIKMK